MRVLGIDFGTSNTVAMVRTPDARMRPLLFDGSPLLPSALYFNTDGKVLVGRDAERNARLDPARFEPNPKRRIDDGLVLLGDHEFAVVDLIAGVLARVAEEWHRAAEPHCVPCAEDRAFRYRGVERGEATAGPEDA